MKDFLKSEFYFFIKNYFYFLILFTVCFYIIMYMNNSDIPTVRNESKVFFYLLILFLFIVISDILKNPLENSNKFISIILFSLFISYIISKIIDHFDKGIFTMKLFKIFGITVFIYIITVFIIYFNFQKKINHLRLIYTMLLTME